MGVRTEKATTRRNGKPPARAVEPASPGAALTVPVLLAPVELKGGAAWWYLEEAPVIAGILAPAEAPSTIIYAPVPVGPRLHAVMLDHVAGGKGRVQFVLRYAWVGDPTVYRMESPVYQEPGRFRTGFPVPHGVGLHTAVLAVTLDIIPGADPILIESVRVEGVGP